MAFTEIIFVLISCLAGSILSRIFFLRISESEELTTSKFDKKIYIPFFINAIKTKTLRRKLILSETFGVVFFLLFALSLLSNFSSTDDIQIPQAGVYLLFYIFISTSLLYLSVFDILLYAIPVEFTKKIFFAVVVINIIVFSVNEFIDNSIFELFNIGDLFTLLGFAIIYLCIYLLVKISKEAGMGAGDIDIVGIIALSLGWPNIFIGMYLSVVIGAILGLLYGLYKGKIKGLIIPFVPLLTLGYAIAIGFSENVLKLLNII